MVRNPGKKPCFCLSAFMDHHLEGHFKFRRIQEQRESNLALLFISFTRRRLANTYFWEVEILSTPAGITDWHNCDGKRKNKDCSKSQNIK